MLSKNKIYCLAGLLFLTGILSAQNNTNSPYTRFGYGEIVDYGSGKSRTMGGTSIGMRSNNAINTTNPASYTGIDSLTFMFEFGGSGLLSRFSNDNASIHSFNANLEYLSCQFPLTKWMAFSAGLLPFSFVGYGFSFDDSIAAPTTTGTEMINFRRGFSGTGSINQAFVGLSTRIGKHLSVGVNGYYLFGGYSNIDSLIFSEETSLGAFSSTFRKSSLQIRDFNFRYGMQYFTNLGKDKKLTVGLIFENMNTLDGNYSIGVTGVDTINSDNKSDFQLPMTLGGGISFEKKNKFTLAADYLFQNWADVSYFGVKDTLSNRSKISVGGEYLPDLNSKNYFKRVTYRFGAFLTNDYLNINKESYNYGITFGFGLPSKGSKSMFNIGVEYGKVGSAANNLIREDYFKFSLSAAFNETWFFKRKFE